MHACQYVHVSCDRWSYVYTSMQPDLIGPLSDHGVTRPPKTVRERVGALSVLGDLFGCWDSGSV